VKSYDVEGSAKVKDDVVHFTVIVIRLLSKNTLLAQVVLILNVTTWRVLTSFKSRTKHKFVEHVDSKAIASVELAPFNEIA
jgi:hypothetical protein